MIELLVVSLLTALVVCLATVRLDGFTRQGRLRTAAATIAAAHRTARTQAMTDGRTRVLEFTGPRSGADKLRIQTPHYHQAQTTWHGGDGFQLPAGVRIETFTDSGTHQHSSQAEMGRRIRISPIGISPTYVVSLTLDDVVRCAVRIDGLDGSAETVWVADAQQFDPFSLLEGDRATQRFDAH